MRGGEKGEKKRHQETVGFWKPTQERNALKKRHNRLHHKLLETDRRPETEHVRCHDGDRAQVGSGREGSEWKQRSPLRKLCCKRSEDMGDTWREQGGP